MEQTPEQPVSVQPNPKSAVVETFVADKKSNTNYASLVYGGVLLVAFLVVGVFAYIALVRTTAPEPAADTVGTSKPLDFSEKKILYIDSYHEGYEWSDGITEGIRTVLEPSGVTLRIVRMDTKRNPDESFIQSAALDAVHEIEVFDPDVLIVSDDNAFKYVVQAYYRDASLPVVFSGLNWDASLYDAPYRNTTGMVEVSLTLQIIEHLRAIANGDRVGYLSAETTTERKNLLFYNKLFGLNFDAVYFVDTFDEWKQAYESLQTEVDMIIFENNAGIENWNDAEAALFAADTIRVPVGTTNPWTMPESVLGITKVPQEQGEWSAQAALNILSGVPVSDIPVAKNKQGTLMVNMTLANRIEAVLSPSILKNALIVR